MQCVLLHLHRKASKSETAPPLVAAESSRREPKRVHVIEHTTEQVQYKQMMWWEIYKMYISEKAELTGCIKGLYKINKEFF